MITKLLELFRSRSLLIAPFTIPHFLTIKNIRKLSLVDWLDYNGYTNGHQPAKFTDAQGRKIKNNMDMELAIDVLEMAEHLDHIILFSGDGDFRRLVEAARRGVRTTVIRLSAVIRQ